MDALILSCGTGGGHDAAGSAVAEELINRGHHAVMLNPYTLQSEQLAEKINHIYISTARKAPLMFGAVYRAGQLYRQMPFRSPVYFLNRLMTSIMEEYLTQNHFDIIITPHLFPAEIITAMKHKGLCPPKTIFIATDYTCIPFTEETECDAYVIPAAELAESFTGRGLPAEKLYPLGIPVHKCFSQGESRSEARARLGLDPDRKYILAAGGSMGGGEIKKAIYALTDLTADRTDTELIVVCGSNSQLYDELRARDLPNVTVIGFTSDMAGYMKAADLFVTKPGGLSSTEAAVCGVPLIHVAEIPGCETFNAQYFSSRGMGRLCTTSVNGLQAVFELLDDPQARDKMLKNQKAFIPANAAAQICSLAEDMAMFHEKGNISIPKIIRPATS